MNATVQTEQATVYRACGRRFLSKGAAVRNVAMRLAIAEVCELDEWDERCNCEQGDVETPGLTCSFHALDSEKQEALIRAKAKLVAVLPA